MRWRVLLLPIALWLALGPWPVEARAHLYGKLEWLWVNGGDDMRAIDVFDLLFHLAWTAVAVAALLPGRRAARVPDAPPG